MNANILTVSALNRQVKSTLEQNWSRVWLTGEISNLATPASGHIYFTLKDDRSQIRCAMFRSRAGRLTFRPEHGMQVLVRANVTLYEPRGDMQLLVESMQPAGDGLLQQQFDALKMRLAGEGLFAQEAKQPLPDNIRKLGVITSPSGAAIRDVLSVLKRRDPTLEVVIYPSLVQGAEAVENLIAMLRTADERDEVDCLLLTRGGGSLEDLWCFNDERLARAIYEARLPIVSAVGHEVDTTISDYVADLRAATPSAAAELLSRDSSHHRQQLMQQQQRLGQAFTSHLRHQRHALALLQSRLEATHPRTQLSTHSQRLDELSLRLERAMQTRLLHAGHAQQRLSQRLEHQHPAPRIQRSGQQVTELQHRLKRATDGLVGRARLQLQSQVAALDAVSPLAVLSRGYSILQDESGNTIKDAGQVSPGQSLSARLHRGSLALTVEHPKDSAEQA
ncbi:exodeoxyribonuclease VII large subunit [Ferrimonas marina]|uniref:Exodeoxyribonuclease 7 large subunit n=1 Tax=Ferrimonas marina TaxID=299255 RepID=A0A1M5S3A8_9GAMM|nr:exodeoxyribonuclease VII large subunit [Ferrimonas marina]SHH32974.1 Exodeoxyribonuclease VII large subunit [Ferrimonas marina]